MQTATDYEKFIQSKRLIDVDSGFHVEIDDLNPMLFDFQKVVVQWALRRGRAAVFGDTGTGKTGMQLCFADHVSKRTDMPVLIFAPLAVSKQTQREGEKFGIGVNVCRTQADVKPGINITNYEMLHHFNREEYGGLVLDESSCLKGIYAKTRKALIEFGANIPYRLACTATPAPNDTMEIVNHAEFLGIMTAAEIFALFFCQDFTATSHKWKLKGHAVEDFWKWLASWARAFRMPSDLGFDDDGFILPELRIHHHKAETDPFDKGMLFPVESITLEEQRLTRKVTLKERVKILANLVEQSPKDEQWLIWTDLNIESHAATKGIPGAVEVKGDDSREYKEESMLGFANGEVRTLVSKPKIAGHGLNLQGCHNVVFLGIGHSFESYYQAVRRCWRFGQTSPVDVHIITADSDGPVIRNLERKEAEATEMFNQLIANMRDFQTMNSMREEAEYIEEVSNGESWTLYLGDSVETIDKLETESVGLSVFSPPFPGMYVFSNSPRDMGNVKDIEEMITHFSFLVGKDKLLRVTMPGRHCAIHLIQGLAFKHSDGNVGLKDFRGRIIDTMEKSGWIYYGEVAIDKDPILRAVRTKDQGLLFQTLNRDAAKSRMALADYVLNFRKPGDNPEPIRSGKADHLKNKNTDGWITNKEWIEWAAPIWYRKTPEYPGGISESDVLSVRFARADQDERHLCALQLGVIERVIKLWSNPGDLVYSPFAGIGSEGVQALRFERRFVGCELKKSYFDVAVSNLREAAKTKPQASLFDAIRESEAAAGAEQ